MQHVCLLNHRYQPYLQIEADSTTCNIVPTRYVDSTPTSEITLVTIRYIHSHQHGHTKSISWSWMDDSHPFRSMSIGRPIPEIRLFQTPTLKLQGQSHGCGHRETHTVGPVSYLFTSFSFHMNQTNNSWDRAISKFDLEKSKVMVMGDVNDQGHILYPVSNDALPFRFTSFGPTIHEIWPKCVFALKKTHLKFRKNAPPPQPLAFAPLAWLGG